jgi:CRISPR system Cascade subunit CasA
MTSFDVRTDPWILCRGFDGEVREYSMLDVFRSAHELESIVGEVATQEFAILRLLLAVLHSAVPRDAESPIEAWENLWEETTLPVEAIEAYLADETRAHRFDLFDPIAPFYQVASLNTQKGDVSGLERLIADVPNGEQYFTTRRGRGVESVSFAEAARWLVHVHAYDTSGIKSGPIGDPRAKGGRGYPLGAGWCGEIGGLQLTGASLRETLLLNLVLGGRADFAERGLPVWDRAPHTAGPEQPVAGSPADENGRRSTGISDLFTWQGRRVRLERSGERVVGVVLAYGDVLRPQNMHVEEPMTAWRYSEPQSKKVGATVMMPAQHDADRLFWQGLASLLPHAVEGATGLTAGILEWAGRLTAANVLDRTRRYGLQARGIAYGTHSSVIDEIVADAVVVHPDLFPGGNREVAAAAVDMANTTEAAVRVLTSLAGDLAVAAGGDAEGPRGRARREAYHDLDAPFRRWLADLDAAALPDARVAWHRSVRRILERVGDELLAATGPAEWIGRPRPTTGHASSSEAREWFRRSLRKTLPGAYDAPAFLTQLEGEPADVH